MKRLITLLSLLAVLAVAAPEAPAQNFLKKLKDKAENALMNAVGLGNETKAEPVQAQPVDVEAEPQTPSGPVSASDQIPKLRVSSVVWEGQVAPSRASDVYGLIDDLPPLPTAEQIARFDESAHRHIMTRLRR